MKEKGFGTLQIFKAGKEIIEKSGDIKKAKETIREIIENENLTE